MRTEQEIRAKLDKLNELLAQARKVKQHENTMEAIKIDVYKVWTIDLLNINLGNGINSIQTDTVRDWYNGQDNEVSKL